MISTQTIVELREALDEMVPKDGESWLEMPFVVVHAYPKVVNFVPETHKSAVYLVVSGSLRVTHEGGVDEYGAGQYLLTSAYKNIPSHFMAVPGQGRHIGIRLDFTAEDVTSVVLDVDVNFMSNMLTQPYSSANFHSTATDFLEVALRLCQALRRGRVSSFLEKHFKQEFIYTLVTGQHGTTFIQDVLKIQGASDIYSTNDWIKGNFKSTFAVDDLAEQTNMSVSNFHKKFKAAIGMGPVQCQKRLRISEARRLMLEENFNVTTVALEVGYESLSQFSRDYKKIFGQSPQKDILELRKKHAGETEG